MVCICVFSMRWPVYVIELANIRALVFLSKGQRELLLQLQNSIAYLPFARIFWTIFAQRNNPFWALNLSIFSYIQFRFFICDFFVTYKTHLRLFFGSGNFSHWFGIRWTKEKKNRIEEKKRNVHCLRISYKTKSSWHSGRWKQFSWKSIMI